MNQPNGKSRDHSDKTDKNSFKKDTYPKKDVPKGWGSVAKHGAGKLQREESEDKEDRNNRTGVVEVENEFFTRANSDRLRSEATEAVSRAKKRHRPPSKEQKRKRSSIPNVPHQLPEASKAFRKLLGEKNGARAFRKLGDAAAAFEEERFNDAQKILRSLNDRTFQIAEVVELLGLINYRLGNWEEASEMLEFFRTITGSTEQHPVLADCYRAQGEWGEVEELWDELRQSSPGAALVTEGRLVAAGSLADQNLISEAIRLLEKGWKVPRHPKEHHLRRAYALGDLYERSGSIPRARELFTWTRRHSPKFADIAQRVRDLS